MAKSTRICSIPDCNKFVFGRGWCRIHYGRWRDYGDPMAGRTPNGAAFQFFAESVLQYSGTGCLTWPYTVNAKGYAMMNSGGRQRIVARMVCTAVHGEPPTKVHEAAHSCGKGQSGCVAPAHIRWATPMENAADRIRHGTSGKGEDCSAAKLTTEQVRQIRSSNLSIKQAASIFLVSPATIQDIRARRTWSWLMT